MNPFLLNLNNLRDTVMCLRSDNICGSWFYELSWFLLWIFLCSFVIWSGQNQWNMVSKQDFPSRNRLFLQNHKTEVMLRADKSKRPRVEKDSGRSLKGQDLPTQNGSNALQCFQQNRTNLRLVDRAVRASGHVLCTRLRIWLQRRGSWLRAKHECW